MSGGATLRLPAALSKGDQVEVRITVEDTWSLRGDVQGTERASRLIAGLPWVVGSGVPWPFTLRTGVPADAAVSVAQSGPTTEVTEVDGVRWVSSAQEEKPPHRIYVGVGDWARRYEPPVGASPAVAVHLFPRDERFLEEFPPFMRTVIAYYEGLLPPFPAGELELFQSPAGAGGFTWLAVPGVVSIQQMQTYGGEGATRARAPHLEEQVMAHEIAHQYWGGLVRPARLQDRWISETFAEMYSCLFVAAAFEPEDCAVREDTWREAWEDPEDPRANASLWLAPASTAWRSVAYEYGPFVFGRTLRDQIGVEGLLGGLDTYVATWGYAAGTTDALQASLEAASGQELDDFFDFWVRGGFVPGLTLRWGKEGGVIESDVPFGRFEVPVRVIYKDRAETVRVQVVDGEGRFSLTQAPKRMALDPDEVLITSRRKVVRER